MPTINGSTTYLSQEAQRLDQQGQLRQAGAQRDTEERAEAAKRLIDTRKQAAELEARARRERECRGSSSGEKERAAEEARRQIQAQAAQERLVTRLKALAFKLVGAVDLDRDWKSYMSHGTKIALDGTDVQDSDVEVLSTPDNKDRSQIRIYTDNGSQDARKPMLQYRSAISSSASCQVLSGARHNPEG